MCQRIIPREQGICTTGMLTNMSAVHCYLLRPRDRGGLVWTKNVLVCRSCYAAAFLNVLDIYPHQCGQVGYDTMAYTRDATTCAQRGTCGEALYAASAVRTTISVMMEMSTSGETTRRSEGSWASQGFSYEPMCGELDP